MLRIDEFNEFDESNEAYPLAAEVDLAIVGAKSTAFLDGGNIAIPDAPGGGLRRACSNTAPRYACRILASRLEWLTTDFSLALLLPLPYLSHRCN
jgi:hypothetical protein